MAYSVITMSNPVYRTRRLINIVMLILSFAAMSFGLFWLFWIIGTLLFKGAAAL